MRFRTPIEQNGKTATGIRVQVTGAKADETRQRRILKAVATLGEGRIR